MIPTLAAARFVLDIRQLRPIQPSGFVPPRQRKTYASPDVQEFLQQAFGGLFPTLQLLDDGGAEYVHVTAGVETCGRSRSVASARELPRGEVMKILEGWISLRKEIMEASTCEGIRSLLLNLRVPDPGKSISLYRIYDAPSGKPGIHILYGFESPEFPSVPVEQAVAAILGMEVDQLDSLLFASMKPSGTTAAVPGLAEVPMQNPQRPWQAIVPFVFLAAALAATGTFLATRYAENRDPTSPASSLVATPTPLPNGTPALPADPPVPKPPLPSLRMLDSETINQPAAHSGDSINLDNMIR